MLWKKYLRESSHSVARKFRNNQGRSLDPALPKPLSYDKTVYNTKDSTNKCLGRTRPTLPALYFVPLNSSFVFDHRLFFDTSASSLYPSGDIAGPKLPMLPAGGLVRALYLPVSTASDKSGDARAPSGICEITRCLPSGNQSSPHCRFYPF